MSFFESTFELVIVQEEKKIKTLNDASSASKISYHTILSIFEMYYITEAQYYTILQNLMMHQ